MFEALLVASLMTGIAVSLPAFSQANSSLFLSSGNVTRSVKGRNTTLTCQGEFQDQSTSPAWYKNYQPMLPSGRAVQEADIDNFTRNLTIVDVQISDSGLYTCSDGISNASTWLTVDVSPSVVVHSNPPADELVDNGRDRVLTCAFWGVPTPAARWILTTELGRKKKLHSRRLVNAIEVSVKESGKYMCIAVNRVGRIHDSVEILLPVPEATDFPVYSPDDYENDPNDPFPTVAKEEGSGPSIVLILVVIGCLVVFVFLAFMTHTLCKHCSCSLLKSSDDTPLNFGNGLMFMRDNLRQISSPFSISPKILRHLDHGRASKGSSSCSGRCSARDKDSSALSVDVAHSRTSEISRHRECKNETVENKRAKKPSHGFTTKTCKETEV